MSTLEEFEAAPVGATAILIWDRAVKTFYEGTDRNWLTRGGDWLSAKEMAEYSYTLDPAPVVPTTAREALDLAWDLAHPVREGQLWPDGAQGISKERGELLTFTAHCAPPVDESEALAHRSLDPLPEPEPEPEPDWLDAPAVLATCERCKRVGMSPTLHSPFENGLEWLCALCADQRAWSDLTDVTPLYKRDSEHYSGETK